MINTSLFDYLFRIFPAMPVEFAFGEKCGVVPLSEHLIAADGDGVREVQRARLVNHRNPHTAVGIFHQHMLGDSARFLAEDDIRAVGVADVRVLMSRLGGEKEVFAALCLFKEIVDRVVVGDIDKIPVVKPRSFEITVGNLKAEGTHQMQSCSRGGAGTGDIAGILRNFRLEKYDI